MLYEFAGVLLDLGTDNGEGLSLSFESTVIFSNGILVSSNVQFSVLE